MRVIGMKRAAMLVTFITCLLLGVHAGIFADEIPSHVNPKREAYNRSIIGGTCEKCGNDFTVSGRQLDAEKTVKCPYCLHKQDTKSACNRYGMAHLQQE